MKKVLIFSISFLINYQLFAQNDTLFYKKIHYDAIYNINGIQLLNKDSANRINCYQFIYNKNKELIEIDYFKNGNIFNNDPYLGVAKIINKYSNLTMQTNNNVTTM